MPVVSSIVAEDGAELKAKLDAVRAWWNYKCPHDSYVCPQREVCGGTNCDAFRLFNAALKVMEEDS